MKEYQKAIINEYVSSALISADPEEHLLDVIYYLIDTFVDTDEKLHDVIEYLYTEEKRITVR
jgi:hypothetical protein